MGKSRPWSTLLLITILNIGHLSLDIGTFAPPELKPPSQQGQSKTRLTNATPPNPTQLNRDGMRGGISVSRQVEDFDRFQGCKPRWDRKGSHPMEENGNA